MSPLLKISFKFSSIITPDTFILHKCKKVADVRTIPIDKPSQCFSLVVDSPATLRSNWQISTFWELEYLLKIVYNI